MLKLTPIQIDENTIVYIETKEEVQLTEPESMTDPTSSQTELSRDDLGKGKSMDQTLNRVQNQFRNLRHTIRAYTVHSLSAFKQIGVANVDKVTLEFGIKIGGKTGIPYITEGSGECHLKVTVESSFPPTAEESTPERE